MINNRIKNTQIRQDTAKHYRAILNTIRNNTTMPIKRATMPILRTIILLIGVVWLTILLMGCSMAQDIHNNIVITPLRASWYSVESLHKEGTWRNSHGLMANGKVFKDDVLTCATRLYPLGTKLRIKNLNNNKSVVVVVTDRIGKRFKYTRIDLSKSAFNNIGRLNEGLIPVRVEMLE